MTDDTKAMDGVAATAAVEDFVRWIPLDHAHGTEPVSWTDDSSRVGTPEDTEPSRRRRSQHTPLLRTIIRTRVFWEAKDRLGLGDHGEDDGVLADDHAVNRFKESLYSGKQEEASTENAVPGEHRLMGPARWLAHQRVPMPGKLAFLESVARSLGDDWSRDSRSFLDVTIAMGRLQLVLRQLVHANAERRPDNMLGSALFTVPPTEAHHFAQCLTEELFRAEGWSTDLFWPADRNAVIDRIADRGHDIVCLSWSTAALAETASATIEAIDSIPIERRPAIVAGGRASHEHQGWLVRLGVDCVCESTYGALTAARQLLEFRASAGGSQTTSSSSPAAAGP